MSVDESRCVRGSKCVDSLPATVAHEPGAFMTVRQVGALLLADAPYGEHGPCARCGSHIAQAIGELPADVAELFELLQPSMAIRYRDPGMPSQPRVKKAPPLPVSEDALALLELIDRELQVWADSVARAAGIRWSLAAAYRAPLQRRVAQASALLYQNTAWLIGLPEQEHPCYSATANRLDGHDGERVEMTDFGPDGAPLPMVTRTGWDGAQLLLQLHKDTTRMAGREPADQCPIPCPKCGRRTLVRAWFSKRVVCRHEACEHHMSDDDYERMATGTYSQFRALADRLNAEEAAS